MSRESYRREFDQQSQLQERQGYMRVDTHRPIWIGCSGGCEQSKKACDCEISNNVPPRTEGTPMSYRTHSGAWTGRTPRTTEERWPSAPVAHSRGWFARLLVWLVGH